MEAELSRVTEENHKLNKMLALMCENFQVLKNQVRDLTGGAAMELANLIILPAKRKDDSVEYSSSDDASKKQCKLFKSKASSTVSVRTDPSDTSLVGCTLRCVSRTTRNVEITYLQGTICLHLGRSRTSHVVTQQIVGSSNFYMQMLEEMTNLILN